MSEAVTASAPDPSRTKAITAVIQHIAKEGDALAEILSAETTRLLKIVGAPDVTVEQLIEAGKSLQATLGYISEIQITLQGKLSALDGNLSRHTSS